MLTQPLLHQLHELRLRGMAAALEQQLTSPATGDLTFDERLALLIQHELVERVFNTFHAHIPHLPPGTRYAYEVRRGHGVDGRHDGVLVHRLLASYTHLRATSRCDWPAKFVRHVRDCLAADQKEPSRCSH